jgi:hypothetical protein
MNGHLAIEERQLTAWENLLLTARLRQAGGGASR